MSNPEIISMTVRLPEPIKKRLDKMSLEKRRSVTNMIQVLIEDAVDAHEADNK